MVPDLVQGAVAAADGDGMAAGRRKGGLDVGRGVGLVVRREDVGCGEELGRWNRISNDLGEGWGWDEVGVGVVATHT